MRIKLKKNHIYILLASALIVFAVILLCINEVYARYTTNNNSNETAHVADFKVSLGDSFETPMIEFSQMYPGASKTYTFTIDTKSEVYVDCYIGLQATTNLPLNYTINGVTIPTDGSLTKVLTIAPITKVTLTIKATWPEDENSLSYLDEIDTVRLNVTIQQAD